MFQQTESGYCPKGAGSEPKPGAGDVAVAPSCTQSRTRRGLTPCPARGELFGPSWPGLSVRHIQHDQHPSHQEAARGQKCQVHLVFLKVTQPTQSQTGHDSQAGQPGIGTVKHAADQTGGGQHEPKAPAVFAHVSQIQFHEVEYRRSDRSLQAEEFSNSYCGFSLSNKKRPDETGRKIAPPIRARTFYRITPFFGAFPALANQTTANVEQVTI